MSDGFIAKFVNSGIMTEGGNAVPLDIVIKEIKNNIYIQTLIQNMSNDSIDWVFRTSKDLGEIINTAFNLNNPTLSALKTLDEIVNNEISMVSISNSVLVISAFASSATAMTAVANSLIAMKAIANSVPAVTVVEASAIAITALESSTLKQTVSGASGVSNNFINIRPGKVFLLTQRLSVSLTTGNLQTRYTIKDNAIISISAPVGITAVKRNRFMTGMEIASTAAYVFQTVNVIIPCE